MTGWLSPVWAALLGAAAVIAGSTQSGLAADVLKFGISTPLSGPAAPWGIPHKNATELIFDEANAQGGLDVNGKKYKVEIVAYDHKYVIAEGVATVNRLIAKDGVKYLSILGGAVVKANEETVNESGVLNLPLAYAEGLVSPKNPLTFHSFPAPPETTTFWKWVKEHHPEIKSVATIAPNDEGVLRTLGHRLQPGSAAHSRAETGHHQRERSAGR